MTDTPASAEPKPATSLMLLREASNGFEVFMLKRSGRGAFPDIHVFPGGKLDPEDADEKLAALCNGVSSEQANAILGVSENGLAYWLACIRECFEESGVLLAHSADQGGAVNLDADILEQERKALHAGECGLLDILTRHRLQLPLNNLAYTAHWITPVIEKRRFNTRFFVARATEDAHIASHDGTELVDSLWIRPQDALDMSHEKKLNLILPTIRNLEDLANFDSISKLFEAKSKNTHEDVQTIMPKFIRYEDGTFKVFMPGDEGYDDV